jgi:hypothetical protein
VVALFEAKIRKIDEDKMQELEEKLIADFNANQKEETKFFGGSGGGSVSGGGAASQMMG